MPVNKYFRGLHFVVGLADQAQAALKVWIAILYKDQPVGRLRQDGYSKRKSGTLRLVRTVCKSVQERGCEKSGRPVHFLTFLQKETHFNNGPLAPFKGNIFNVLLLNDAGIFSF